MMNWITERRSRVLLCASGVSFMIVLDSNIVAVALPTIARDLNAAFASGNASGVLVRNMRLWSRIRSRSILEPRIAPP